MSRNISRGKGGVREGVEERREGEEEGGKGKVE